MDKEFILDVTDRILNTTHSIIGDLGHIEWELNNIGMLDDKTKIDIAKIKNKCMGAYECCQFMERKVNEKCKEVMQ